MSKFLIMSYLKKRRKLIVFGLVLFWVGLGLVLGLDSVQAQSGWVSQEIRYRQPEVGEVFLLWGLDGWAPVAEANRPAGTVIKERVMHTPMRREGDTFVVEVQIPAGAALDYGFLITRNREGEAIEPIWDGDESYQASPTADGVIEVRGAEAPGQPGRMASVGAVWFYLLVGIGVIGLLAVIFRYAPQLDRPRVIMIILIGLTVLGLAVRLGMAWRVNLRLPDTPERLTGDEPGYDYLAHALLEGEFFQWPGRTPVYPLFLAACYFLFGHSYAIVLYVQAVVGAAAIPLTFWLARRFTGSRGALLAAAIIALDLSLARHAIRLYSEIIYTPLFLLALLSLLWALDSPRIGRFAVAGALLAVANLTRPTAILLPLLLPLFMSWSWSLKQRAMLTLVYAGAMAAVIAPWSYHNYRTHDTFLPLSVSTALLWQGSPEFYHLMEQRMTLIQIWGGPLNPEQNGGYDAFTIEGDRYFTSRAIASIRAEPGVYAWYSLQKLAYFWIGHPVNDWPHYAIFSMEAMRPYFSALRIAEMFAARLLPIAALGGLIILRRRWRSFFPLVVICGYFMLIHAVTFTEVRYSLPLHPILATIIAAAVAELARRYRTEIRSLALAVRARVWPEPASGQAARFTPAWPGQAVQLHSAWGWLLVGLIGLGVIFRFTHLEQKFYWHDEAYSSIRAAGYTEAEIIANLFSGDLIRVQDVQPYQQPHPERAVVDTVTSLAVEDPHHAPLYYILASLWMRGVGSSVEAMRSLSVWLSLLALPAIYWLALELFKSRLAAWTALALFSLSPFHILYAQEAREYSLWTVTILLSSAALLGTIRQPTPFRWGVYTVTVVLGLYSHQFFALVAVAHGIYILGLAHFRWSGLLAGYMLASGIALLLFAPWILVIITYFAKLSSATAWTAEPVGALYLVQMWILNLSSPFVDLDFGFYNPLTYGVRLLALILVGYSLYFVYRHTERRSWLLVFALIGVSLMALLLPDLVWGGIRSTVGRYLIPVYLGFQLAVAYFLTAYLTASFPLYRYISYLVVIGLIIGGVSSWADSARAESWWNKVVSPENPQVARVLNQAASPVLLVEEPYPTNLGDVLSLSHLLRPDIQLRLGFEPVDLDGSHLSRETFILYPSETLREHIEQAGQYELEPVVRESLWRLQQPLGGDREGASP